MKTICEYPKRWVVLFLTFMSVCLGASAENLTIDAEAWSINGQVGHTYDVTIANRTYAAGQWDVICLPFDASATVLDAAFGVDNYSIQEFDELSGSQFKFKVMSIPSLTAGYAYFIQVNNEVADPVFPGVTLQMNSETTIKLGSETNYFRGCFFPMAGWDLINNHSAYKWYNGALMKMAYSGGVEQSDLSGCNGFFHTDGSTAITVSLEGNSGGSGGSGGDSPDPTTLEGKIAAKLQLTDIPTIYIDVAGIATEQDLKNTLYKIRKNNADEEEVAPYAEALITVVDDSEEGSQQHLVSFSDSVQIKVRGNSTASAGNGKVPYRLKFAKKHKHDLLGYGYDKRNWTLIANNYDGTMIRNALTYHVGQYLGMDFTPGYKFVDLVISGLYRGTYMVSDHCEVGSHRIDIDEDNDWYLEFECWGSMAEAPYVGQGDGDDHFVSIKNPDADDLTEEQVAQLKADVQAWRKEWKASFDNGSWQKYNDLESFVKFYLATEITGDLDSYFVFKGYKLAGDNHFHWGPLWDKDLAFGNYGDASDPEKLTAYYGKTGFEWVFKNTLFKNKVFLNAAYDQLTGLINDGLVNNLMNDIDDLAALIENSRELNYTKWSLTNIENGYFKMADYDEHITALKNYLTTRVASIQSQLAAMIDDLPAPTAADYNPENAWWGTGLSAGTNYNLTLINRTLTANQWNTFCLPFDATQAQMEAALGCTYELAVHTGMDTDGTTMLFDAPATKDVESGVPYLIKPTQDVASFDAFDDVYYTAPVTNNSANAYNGNGVTFDGEHYFYASLFTGYNLSTATDYLFSNDVYVDNASLIITANDNQPGCRAFIRVPTGENPAIRFGTANGDEPVVRTQLTDVPTIYIDTEIDAETGQNKAIQPSTGEYVKAAIQVIDANGTLTEFTDLNDMEIRGRGMESWNQYDKKSYRLKFAKKKNSSDGLEHKYDLTGGGYVKRNWVLLANAGDETLVRNALTKTLGDQMGMSFTPGYCFVDLVINGEYVGSYMATDFIEADVARVFVENEDTDWLIEMTTADGADPADLIVEGDDNTPYVTIKNPESSKTVTEEEILTKVADFFTLFWNDNTGQYYDQSSFVNWYIATEILGGYNSLTDIYAYKGDVDETLSFGPLWGNEFSYNNADNQNMLELMGDLNVEGSYEGMVFNSAADSPWKTKLAELWQQAWFKNAVKTRWDEVAATLKTQLLTQLAALEQQVEQTYIKNFTDTSLVGEGWTTSTTLPNAVAVIETYLNARFPYLDAKFAELAAVSLRLGDVNGDGELDINDVMALVSYICQEPPSVFFVEVANVNNDDDIDINDVMMLVDMILSEANE